MAKLGRPKLFDVRETIRLSAIMHKIIRLIMNKNKKTFGGTVRQLVEESPQYKAYEHEEFPTPND